MKTFRQFLETIKHDNIAQELTKIKKMSNILSRMDKKSIVQFAYHCAERAYNVAPNMSAQYCLFMVRKWLQNESLVEPSQLERTYQQVNGEWNQDPATRSAACAVNAAHYAADQYGDIKQAVMFADRAFNHAVHAIGANSKEDESVSAMKEAEADFYQFATSMLSKTDLNIKPATAFTREDPESIMVMLDELEEAGENIVISTQNGVALNLPNGDHLVAKNKIELVHKITDHKNRWVIDWLKRMYGS